MLSRDFTMGRRGVGTYRFLDPSNFLSELRIRTAVAAVIPGTSIGSRQSFIGKFITEVQVDYKKIKHL